MNELSSSKTLLKSEHLSSPLAFSGVRVTRSLVSYVCFVDRCLSFCLFSFGHCVVCSLIYGFWLPLWYRQTLLSNCCLISSEQLFTISLRTIYFTLQTLLSLWHITFLNSYNITRGSHGCDHMVVGLTTTCAISAYHHWCWFESHSGRGVQHYVIKFASDLWQVGGFL